MNINIILFTVMLYALAFDYRSTDGSSKFLVIAMGLLSIFSGLLLLFKTRYINRQAIPLILAISFFILISFLSAFLREQPIYEILSIGMPILLFFIVFITTASLNINEKHIKRVIYIIVYFLFLSVLFKLIFGFLYYGLSLENVRYQIISPTIIFLFSYGLTSILYKKQELGYIALIISLLVVFLSVTRTYIFVFFMIGLFWIFVFRFSSLLKIKKIKFIFKILILLIILLIGVYFFLPEVFDRWVIRLFTGVSDNGGVDVTYYTRIAEAKYQIDKLLEGYINFFGGLGIAGETRFSSEYKNILDLVFSEDFEYHGKGFGHNTYVGIIFTGGILAGSVFIYALLVNILKSTLSLKKRIKRGILVSNSDFLIGWGTSSTIGYFSYSFLGGIYGDRLASLSYALAFGLIFLGKRFNKKNETK